MGYDLTALNSKMCDPETGEAAVFTVQGWGELLSLANKNGWTPKGITQSYNFRTEQHEPYPQTEDHVDEYFGNNYQVVEADDAKEIAKALFAATAEPEGVCGAGLTTAANARAYIRAFAEWCDKSEGFLIG